MDAIMESLMSGGWEPDYDLDIASDYELAMERAEQENPDRSGWSGNLARPARRTACW